MHVSFVMVKKVLFSDLIENEKYNCVIVAQFSFIFHCATPEIKVSINNFKIYCLLKFIYILYNLKSFINELLFQN